MDNVGGPTPPETRGAVKPDALPEKRKIGVGQALCAQGSEPSWYIRVVTVCTACRHALVAVALLVATIKGVDISGFDGWLSTG